MKILHITPALSNEKISHLNTVSSGLGYMVFDIAYQMSLLSNNEVEILNIKDFNPKTVIDDCCLFGIRCKDIKKYIFISNFKIGFKHVLQYGKSFKDIRNIFYYTIISGVLNKYIRSGKYDIIHLHGCDYYSDFIVDICVRHKIPLLITLHGLNSFGGINVTKSIKKHERNFLKFTYMQNKYISFVSTGCMKKVCNWLNVPIPHYYNSIPNGCDIDKTNTDTRVRIQYNIPENAFIILYVGNIGSNKNQRGFAEAFLRLSEDEQKNIYVMFIGRDHDNLFFKEFSCKNEHLICCGFVEKKIIHKYYQAANAVALVSISEGFGLGLIEGFAYGLPGLAVKDMDAIEDIYDENSLILIEKRDIDSICEGIRKLVKTRWNKYLIMRHSEKFSLNQMTKNYLKTYNIIINNAI